MKKKQPKLRNLINESVLGELPSAKMFKYNKSIGRFEAPGKHSTNEETINEQAGREFKVTSNGIKFLGSCADLYKAPDFDLTLSFTDTYLDDFFKNTNDRRRFIDFCVKNGIFKEV
jgi:hypothetical protein